MGVSGAAITYLVGRMIDSGHLRRDSDPADRRKVILRYADHGRAVGAAFFTPLAAHTHAAMANLLDADLAAVHRVFTALIGAMHRFQDDLTAAETEPSDTSTSELPSAVHSGGGSEYPSSDPIDAGIRPRRLALPRR